MRIPDRIVYLLHMNNWTEKELGGRLANEAHGLDAIEQWQVSRWKRGAEEPSRVRVRQVEQLCYRTALSAFGSPNGLRYICNLGHEYGPHYRGRADEALDRLREVLIRECPSAPIGRLNIVVFTADLPDGVRAQCFCSDHITPRYFVVIVRDDPDWLMNVRDEVFAHVLPMTNLSGVDVKEN